MAQVTLIPYEINSKVNLSIDKGCLSVLFCFVCHDEISQTTTPLLLVSLKSPQLVRVHQYGLVVFIFTMQE
jgi:hypothetical protein